jgi:DNA-binding transcriptional LysR family regulator
MELLQLRYFMTAAHFQSTTRAAEYLHVAQPSISQAISRLEKELDVKLFNRDGKKIQLNSYGILFLRAVEDAFETLDKTLDELRLIKVTSAHPLTVSLWPRSALCSRILIAFSDRYPYVELKVVPDGFENHDLTLLSRASHQLPPPPSEVIFQEEIFLAVHKNHNFAQYDALPLEAVRDENFIMLTKGCPFRQMADSFCELAGFTPKVAFESDYADTLHRMLRLGMGVALLPEKTWKSREHSHFKMIKIASPVCMRTIHLAWKRDRELSPTAQIFRDFVKQYLKREF